MTKKRKIILAIVIVACIFLAFMVGKKYSKYTKQLKGEAIAEIATWNFKVNGKQEEIQTIPLQSTGNNKIAPGSNGSFNIIVDGTDSEVGIDYHITFTDETTKPTNLKFVYNNQTYNSIFELEKILSGTIYAEDEDKTKVLTIGWQWPYETGNNENEIANNDKIDTKNAQEIDTYTFHVIVSGTQVKPEK